MQLHSRAQRNVQSAKPRARSVAVPVAAPRLRRAARSTCAAATPVDGVDGTTIAYWAIGASAVSFVGTFGLAPIFKSSFKEDADWQTVYRDLVASGGVPSVSPAAAYGKRKSAVLVDVRLGMKYDALHPEGAISVPLYIPIQGWSPAAIIRRLGFGFFGIYGTQLNTEFTQQAAEAIPKGREVILLCENGGSLENKSGTMYGFQSRSLKAAYFLRKAGYSKISYVKGGIAQWGSDGLPLSDGAQEEEDGDSGSGKQWGLPELGFARRR